MKRFSILLALLIISFVLAVSASAQDYIIWDFRDHENVDKWVPSKSTELMVTSDGSVISGSDNNINLSFVPEQEIKLSDYKYFAAVLANVSEAGTFQFYHWTSTSSGNPRLDTGVAAGEGVTFVTFDLNESVPATAHWDGVIKNVRLDPNRGLNPRSVIVVYVGLFKDKAAFEAYNAANPVEVKAGMSESELSVVTPAVPAEKNKAVPVIWDMSDAADSAKWIPSSTSKVTVTEKGSVVSGSGNDLNLTFRPAEGEDIILDDYDVLAIGYADYTVGGGHQLYFWTDKNTGNPRFETAVGAGKTGVLKYDTSSRAEWTGKVKTLRVDPARGDEQRDLTVTFIGLFPDNATYNAYINGTLSKDGGIVAPGQPVKLYNLGINNTAFGIEGNEADLVYEDTYGIITATGSENGICDPFITVKAGFDGDDFPWMKIRLRNISDATRFEMHFASEGSRNGINASTVTHFPISSKDADFVEYVVNIKELNVKTAEEISRLKLTSSMWTGNISAIRFDCMWIAEPSGQVPSGSQMYIDYVGFFASEQEAKDYIPDASTESEKPAFNTGKTAPQWIFDSSYDISSIQAAGLAISTEAGVMRVSPTTSDPTMSFYLGEEQWFDTAEFPYFAYRHNSSTTVSTTGIFFTTSNLASLSDASWSPFRINTSGKWQNIIINLGDTTAYPKANWTGICNFIRLDPINGNDLNADIYIDRMGFFRTQSDAYKFLKEGNSGFDYTKGAVYTDVRMKAIVPDGALYEGYKASEYTLSAENAQNANENSVVVRINADDSETVIPLSNTGKYGYTTYIADKPGTYKLADKRKTYTDTAGHWGESYINYVSDRTLFGGTSPTEFSPDEAMTRGMFITVLGRMHGVDTSKYDGNTGYSDVAATEYYAPYIQWAKEIGIMPGTSDSSFAPETPIYRETMAAVIASYISAFGYSFTTYNDPVTFNDLTSCDAATVNAINAAAEAGIINGKGDGIFDPKGSSTRAEVATVMQRVIKSILGVNTVTSPYTPEYFQRERIRIGAWGFVSRFGNKQGMEWLRDLGVDTIISGSATSSINTRNDVFNYADLMGIEVFVSDFPTNQQTLNSDYDIKAHVSAYAEHPSFSGHNITDEPGTDDFGWLGDLSDKYMEALPGKIPFVNLLPMYANAAQLKMGAGAAAIEYYDADPELYRKHCQAWFENFNVDYICTDIYPLNGTTGTENRATWNTYGDYCEAINQIATVARENDAEFWCCIQTWGWTRSKRTPTAPEYRWQCYAMLSYGCTGILLWSLNSSNSDLPSVLNSFSGTKTQPVYDDCAEVMWEMRNLSDTFIQYKNLGAFTLNCTNATPWLKMSGEYKSFDILTETVSSEPLLIGCFDKKEGAGHAFTVVNMTDLKDNKPATFKFKLSTPMTVTLYDEAKPTVLKADADGYYTINLDSTDGVFVTIG